MFRQMTIVLMKWLNGVNPVGHFLNAFPRPDFNFRGYFYEAAVHKLSFHDTAGN